MNYNYIACCWFPTSSNILILPSQFWQIRFKKLLIALFKVFDRHLYSLPSMHTPPVLWNGLSPSDLTVLLYRPQCSFCTSYNFIFRLIPASQFCLSYPSSGLFPFPLSRRDLWLLVSSPKDGGGRRGSRVKVFLGLLGAWRIMCEGAKRPSEGRVWEGETPLPR